MDDAPEFPADRLAELLAAVEEPTRRGGGARDAPQALVQQLRAAALASFAGLAEHEQVEMLCCVTDAEREDFLTALPPTARERLRRLSTPEIGMAL